jgi:hypothetical protein
MNRDHSLKITILAHELVQTHLAENQTSLKAKNSRHCHVTPLAQESLLEQRTTSGTTTQNRWLSFAASPLCPISKYEAIELEALFYYVAKQGNTTSQALKDFAAKALKIQINSTLCKANYLRLRAFLWQCSLSSRS